MPEEPLETLRRRARERHMSLSAYVREILVREAQRRTMADVLSGPPLAGGADLSNEEIRALIEEGRR